LELLLIPFLFALVSLVVPSNFVRQFSLIGGIVSLVVTIGHLCSFDTNTFVTILDPSCVTSFGLTCKMGYDGMSLFMVLLTNVITFLIILSNYNRDIASNRSFTALVFFMQLGLLGVFTSFDGLLFYIFWEITLIPVFLIALWYGGKDRKAALVKFFIYTFVGSLAMLLSLMAIKGHAKSFSYLDLMAVELTAKSAFWIFGGFFLAFAIKIPLFPFHTWQPNTYTSSPMAGTMLLSALMLKMALYGMIRWLIPLAPEALTEMTYPVVVLGIIGVVYAGILAIKQNDIKRLFAFASISHVGLIAAGAILLGHDNWSAVFIQMANHSLVAVGLFLSADIIEQRLGIRTLSDLGGIAKQAPRFAFMFGALVLAAISVPLSSGFIGEFMLLKGIFSYNWLIGFVAGTTLVVGAIYTLRAYQLSMYGAPKATPFADLTWNEWLAYLIIMVIIVVFGVYPQAIIDFLSPSIDSLLESVKTINTLHQ
jgi:NADH-quinone oxidoreductase subunit M